MATPGIPNDYALSTSCFGTRLGTIQDQIFAAVGMGFRRLELGLTESPPSMDGLEESQRETGVQIPALVAGCRDSLNGSMACERLGSTSPEECERAMNSIRRHVRLAQSWGCPIVVVRGSRMEDPELLRRAGELSSRFQREEVDAELKEELLDFVKDAQKRSHGQIERFCRSLHSLMSESDGVRFAVEPGRDVQDLLGYEAMGWILDDLRELGYWHDVGRIHLRERMGLPTQGQWLESYGSRMFGVHLQDAGAEGAEMPLGAGEVDFRLVAEYVPQPAERVLEIGPSHGRAEILASVQFLSELGL